MIRTQHINVCDFMPSKPLSLLFCALALVLLGSSLSSYINTAGGRVEVTDLRFTTPTGGIQSALLYRPLSATAKTQAPGILAIHGYINSRETQSGFAIELARRGFVVLAIDQSGHGHTTTPAFADAFGSTNGLNYLRNLPFVDKQRIGLEGHSMGGWASRAATQLAPELYHSIVMVGSSTIPLPFGDYTGTATDPKNIAIVFSLYDEFSEFMWQGAKPLEVANAPKLKALFGTETPVETNRLYGSIEDGTGRQFYQPATTHPGDHISPEAVLNAVEWLQLTLRQDSDIAADDHIFLWKEVGTFIALVGLILCIFPLSTLLIKITFFSTLQGPMPPNFGDSGGAWWLNALLTCVIPVATFFLFSNWTASVIPANAIWPQSVTTGIAGWALFNGLITLVLLGLRHWQNLRKRTHGGEQFGLDLSIRQILKSLLLAATVVGILAVLASVIEAIFISDFRFWVVALKPMSWGQWQIFFCYLPIFILFFLVFSANFNGPLRRIRTQGHDLSLAASASINAGVAALGFSVLLVIQYSTLFTQGTLLIDEPLLTIVALQFVPLLIVIACISTFGFRLTGRSYLGAFINGLFVTWYIVAGQATHFS